MTHSHEGSTNVRIFVSMQPIFICLVHCPIFRKLRGVIMHAAIQPVGCVVTQLSLYS